MSKLTPMMQQYKRIKAEQEDKLLFFRLGDFYELFMEDAETAARELEITLTGRDAGGGERVPMCGVPHHSADGYIRKLVEKGYRVAICEQVEDPDTASGLVRREVVRTVTPGTITDLEALDEKTNNYIVAVVGHSSRIGLAAADVSTGEFRVTEFPGQTITTIELPGAAPEEGKAQVPARVLDELQRLQAREVVFDKDWEAFKLWRPALEHQLNTQFVAYQTNAFSRAQAERELKNHFDTPTLQPFGCEEKPAAVRAGGGLMSYLRDTQKDRLSHITSLVTYNRDDQLVIDANTRRNLELTQRLADGARRGSLLGVLDHTVTAMGGRKLKAWIEQPLVDVNRIRHRLDAVEELLSNPFLRDDLHDVLRNVYDIERLTARASYGTANPRELTALRQSLQLLPRLADLLEEAEADTFVAMHANLDLLEDVTGRLQAALVDDPPAAITDGGIIRDGFNDKIDELRSAQEEGTEWIAELQKRERERTGIKSLKVGFNKVFGYYIEVTNPNLDSVPDNYERKQTLSNSERYIVPELKEKEAVVLGAEDRLSALEHELFVELRTDIANEAARLRATAALLARLDALLALAEAAEKNNYVRPEVDTGTTIDISQSRHPVLEQIQEAAFVPNDCYLDREEDRVLIITGPNMAGKSTYMRQVALVVLMAQLGSFVPAGSAHIGIVDRIFSRVGASDDLSRGQSTFMVEMVEVSQILRHATDRSLIILDEVGRGTSTFDGMALAQAVVEYIHSKVGARTLCSTHYHELTALDEEAQGIRNMRTEVAEEGDDIVFLYQVKPGAAGRSYGINVARLAHLPVEVLERAKELLQRFEERAGGEQVTFAFFEQAASAASSSEAARRYRALLQELDQLDLMTMTPLEVMNWAYDYQLQVKRALANEED